jgi:hypothetical protein
MQIVTIAAVAAAAATAATAYAGYETDASYKQGTCTYIPNPTSDEIESYGPYAGYSVAGFPMIVTTIGPDVVTLHFNSDLEIRMDECAAGLSRYITEMLTQKDLNSALRKSARAKFAQSIACIYASGNNDAIGALNIGLLDNAAYTRTYLPCEITLSEMYGDSAWAWVFWPSSFVIPFQNVEREARLNPANTSAAAVGVPASRSLSRTALTFAFLFAPLLVTGIAVLGPSEDPV